MTPAEIAEAAGFDFIDVVIRGEPYRIPAGGVSLDAIDRFASALRAQVLEEAAKVCDGLCETGETAYGAEQCATDIRALKDKTNG